MAMANNTAPRTAFRFNPRRQSEERTRVWLAEHSIEIRESALTPQAYVIENGNLSWSCAPVLEGWIYLQDEASQLVPHLIADSQISSDVANKESHENLQNPQSAIRSPQCWDVCAAPGSKTTLLASLLKKGSLIVASDFYDHRLRTMKELNNKLGFDQIKLIQLDATHESPSDTDSSITSKPSACRPRASARSTFTATAIASQASRALSFAKIRSGFSSSFSRGSLGRLSFAGIPTASRTNSSFTKFARSPST